MRSQLDGERVTIWSSCAAIGRFVTDENSPFLSTYGAAPVARVLRPPRSLRTYLVWLGWACSLLPHVANAQAPDAPVEPPPGTTPPVEAPVMPPETTPVAEPGKHEGKKHEKDASDVAIQANGPSEARGHGQKKKKKQKLTFRGRVFARMGAVRTEPIGAVDDPEWLGRSEVASARARAVYRTKHLHAELSLELAGKARLKNAFVELPVDLGGVELAVRAGQFKVPYSAIERESAWTLPTLERGTLHDTLVHRLQVAGRSIGAMVAVEPKAGWKPTLELGAFQAYDDADNALEASASDSFGHNLVLRLSARPVKGFEIGASGSTRVGKLLEPGAEIQRAYAGELDITLHHAAGPGEVRAWLEGMVGTSWLVGGSLAGHIRTRFVEARGILGYRFGGEAKHWFVEPFVMAGVLDPDRIIDSDRLRELVAGIQGGITDRWRLGVELAARTAGDNAPLGIVEFAAPAADIHSMFVQLGARFP